MHSESFLLDMDKTTLPFVKLALTTVVKDSAASGISSIPGTQITNIVSQFSGIIELLRQQNYLQARDQINAIRLELINIQAKLFLSPEDHELYSGILNHLSCIANELFYIQFIVENRNTNSITFNL